MNSHRGLLPLLGSSSEPVFLRVSELERLLPYKKSWIWSQVKQGAFPQPIKISTRCTVWRRDEVLEWISKRAIRRVSAEIDQ